MSDFKTQAVLLCLAILTGVLNYYGLSLFVPPDAWFQKALCAMTGIGVTLVISLFWSYGFSIIPDLRTPKRRIGGWLIIFIGILLILSISTYWNLIAIAGDEIARLSSGDVVTMAELALAQSVDGSGLFQSFLSDVAAFHSDVAAQVAAEAMGGTSGNSGYGPIATTMDQVAERLKNLIIALGNGSDALAELRSTGDQCLAGLHTASGDAAQIASEVTCVNGVIGDLANQNMLSAIERGMRSLTDGIVLPAAIRTNAQHTIIAGFMAENQLRADGIASLVAAMDVPLIEPVSAGMPNRMEGVLLHWRSILPAIATAAAIDLLPAVLLVLKTLHGDDRTARDEPRGNLSARDLADALDQMARLQKHLNKNEELPAPYVDLPDEDWSITDDLDDVDVQDK